MFVVIFMQCFSVFRTLKKNKNINFSIAQKKSKTRHSFEAQKATSALIKFRPGGVDTSGRLEAHKSGLKPILGLSPIRHCGPLTCWLRPWPLDRTDGQDAPQPEQSEPGQNNPSVIFPSSPDLPASDESGGAGGDHQILGDYGGAVAALDGEACED
jgi:hypothetical protein